MNQIIIDLGFGDSGKGVLTSLLASQSPDTSLVVRYTGGCQSAHNVIYDGRHHTFSQFGSATFQGIPTYIGPKFLFSPTHAILEAEELVSKGVKDVHSMLTVDDDARLVTPFHAVANRLEEESRGSSNHGSCGVGIGVTVEYDLLTGNAPRARDIKGPSVAVLMAKMNLLRDFVVARCAALGSPVEKSKYANMFENAFFDEYLSKLLAFRRLFKIQEGPPDTFNSGTVIFEGSQGMLLDQYFLAPHNTWSDITVRNARMLIEKYAHDKTTEIHPVIRSYMTRHGAGPMPTEKDMVMNIPPDVHNVHGKYQGNLRIAAPDFPLWRTAMVYSGIEETDTVKLCVTHMDRMRDISLMALTYAQRPTRAIHYRVPEIPREASYLNSWSPVYRRLPDSIQDIENDGEFKTAALEFYAAQLSITTDIKVIPNQYIDSPCPTKK